MARSLQILYPNARLEVHGKFQTAALLWHNDPTLKSLWIDFATARTEFYPYPAANPEVEASSIQQDLYRRDFTINAMAIRLTNPHAGTLLDFFGGTLDLQAKQMRVLHANSFIEDPTRIYRAVRFAVRLGFQLDPQTEGYIRYAIATGVYAQAYQSHDRLPGKAPLTAPALQTRLKAELKYILQSPYWKPALQYLSDLGALQCLHPTLAMDATLWRQLRLVDRWFRRRKAEVGEAGEAGAAGEAGEAEEAGGRGQKGMRQPLSLSLPPSWLVLLEVLLAHLAAEYRGLVAERLQLPLDSIERLQQLEAAQTRLRDALPDCQPPSEVIQLLKSYDPLLLALIAVRLGRSTPHTIKDASPHRKIWQYLTHWSKLKPLLDGNDLKAMGYKPSPQFKAILDALFAATADGMIQTRSDAAQFVEEHFSSMKGKTGREE